MKRANSLYDKIISFTNILLASKKARKGKRYKHSTALFELNLEKNIFAIMEALKNKTYKMGGYKDFFIFEPKKRLISAAPYFDRVVHHAIMNIINPVISKSFIYDSYACIENKGTHKAIDRYKTFLKKNRYVLKCDIKKYFHRIDHEILFDKIEKKIKCRDTLWLIKTIIDSKQDKGDIEYFTGDDIFTPVNRKIGIPIGNLTSQFFANLYLNDFDHFMKEDIKAKYYIRYCDDFVVFGSSKKWLNMVKREIEKYLAKIRLRLHENKSRIFSVSDGVDFLGLRIFPEYALVRKSVVKKYRKKLRKMSFDYGMGKIVFNDVHRSVQSWLGHVKHANSYKLREEIFSNVIFVKNYY